MYQADNILLSCMQRIKKRDSVELRSDIRKTLIKLDKLNEDFDIDHREINHAISMFLNRGFLSIERGSIIYKLEEDELTEANKNMINRNLTNEQVEKLNKVVSQIYN